MPGDFVDVSLVGANQTTALELGQEVFIKEHSVKKKIEDSSFTNPDIFIETKL